MECPEEILTIAGTTGNVYTITIGPVPTCDCPQGKMGVQCKHIVFSLVRVLRAPESLQYQLSFLKAELRTIFAQAPPIVPVNATDSETNSNRKPISRDDNCPICFSEFEHGHKDTVFCKAACGNNIHNECMEQWAASRNRNSAPVTCPFCRSNWTEDEDTVKAVVKSGSVNAEGYVNVGSELGLPTQRGQQCMKLHSLNWANEVTRLFYIPFFLGSQTGARRSQHR
jgi:hypothetical protein